MAVIGGLATLVYGVSGTEAHGWWSVRTVTALALAAVLLVAFLALERRAAKPLFPPHVWKLQSLVSGTAVMLGVTGILVGTVFLTSIFLQTVLGFSALETGLAFLPFALAITAGTVVAKHAAGPPLPACHRDRRAAHHRRRVAVALHRRRRGAASHRHPPRPGPSLGLGVGMVFVPVSVTSMAGIPASHAGVASGFLMTGHEVGAALGVAILSAVASTAGTLTTAAGAADAFSAGSSAPPSSAPSSRSSRWSGCRRRARPAVAATCTCTDHGHHPGHTPATRVAGVSPRQGRSR